MERHLPHETQWRIGLVCLVLLLILLALPTGIEAETRPGDAQETDPTHQVQIPIGTLVPLPTNPPLGVPTNLPSLPTAAPTLPPIQPTTAPPVTVTPTPIPATVVSATVPPPIANVTPQPADSTDVLDPPGAFLQATVIQQARLCPSTFYANAALASAYAQLCTILPYQVWLGAQPVDSGPMSLRLIRHGQSSSAKVVVGDVELGFSTIAGFTPVRTVCQGGADPVFDAPWGDSPSRKIVSLTAGQTLTCTWYISTTPTATGTVNVSLHECAEAPRTLSKRHLQASCTTPLNGVLIWENDLQDEPSGKESNYNGVSGDAGPGMVSFSTTPAGAYEVFAQILAYQEDPNGATVVGFCTGQSTVTLPAESGWMPVDVRPGTTVGCDIYFIPGKG